MKRRKIMCMLLTGAFAAILSACGGEIQVIEDDKDYGWQGTAVPAGDTQGVPERNLSDIEMQTEYTNYPTNVTQIVLWITNHGDTDFCYSADAFSMQRRTGADAWEAVPYFADENSFTALGGIVTPDETVSCKADLARHYALPLAAGVYRIEKDGLYAEFIVSDLTDVITDVIID